MTVRLEFSLAGQLRTVKPGALSSGDTDFLKFLYAMDPSETPANQHGPGVFDAASIRHARSTDKSAAYPNEPIANGPLVYHVTLPKPEGLSLDANEGSNVPAVVVDPSRPRSPSQSSQINAKGDVEVTRVARSASTNNTRGNHIHDPRAGTTSSRHPVVHHPAPPPDPVLGDGEPALRGAMPRRFDEDGLCAPTEFPATPMSLAAKLAGRRTLDLVPPYPTEAPDTPLPTAFDARFSYAQVETKPPVIAIPNVLGGQAPDPTTAPLTRPSPHLTPQTISLSKAALAPNIARQPTCDKTSIGQPVNPTKPKTPSLTDGWVKAQVEADGIHLHVAIPTLTESNRKRLRDSVLASLARQGRLIAKVVIGGVIPARRSSTKEAQ